MRSIVRLVKAAIAGRPASIRPAHRRTGVTVPADDQMDRLFQADRGGKTLVLGDGRQFGKLIPTHRGMSLVGRSVDGRTLIKIGLTQPASRRNSLAQEADVIAHLNAQGCLSCPRLLGRGEIARPDLTAAAEGDAKALVEKLAADTFPYLVLDYIPTSSDIPFADAVLSLVEQKSLGVYCGDFKPRNLRYDAGRGICFIVDYDQAMILDHARAEAPMAEFVAWANQQEAAQFGYGDFLRQFSQTRAARAFPGLFRNGAFDLGSTRLLQNQKTTRAEGGIYHQIDMPAIHLEGVRGLEQRADLLDRMVWGKDERVLDIGCNMGLLSFYLHDKGCAVTGADMDPDIVTAARFVANISGKRVAFRTLDLDSDGLGATYDTIMLFSVLHHTQNVEANARKIAAACRRVVIECRLAERGAKPIGDKWVQTSAWEFKTVDDLCTYLESIFSGFRLREVVGAADKGRYVIEIVKKA